MDVGAIDGANVDGAERMLQEVNQSGFEQRFRELCLDCLDLLISETSFRKCNEP